MKDGAEQAVADLNKAGGVLGQQVVLEVGDDACDPKQAVSVANQIASHKVVFVAGHYCSGSSIPASKVYAEEGILQISPASTNPKYHRRGQLEHVPRLRPRRPAGQGRRRLPGQDTSRARRSRSCNDNSAYGKGLADETKKALNAGGRDRRRCSPPTRPARRTTRALVSRLKQAGVDVIYVGGYHTEAGLIIRQAKEQGMKVDPGRRRRAGDQRVLADRRRRPASGTLMTFPPDPRQDADRRRRGEGVQGQEHRSRGLRALHLRARSRSGPTRRRRPARTDPKKVADGAEGRRHLADRAGPDHLRQEGRHRPAAGYVFYVWKNGNYAQM